MKGPLSRKWFASHQGPPSNSLERAQPRRDIMIV